MQEVREIREADIAARYGLGLLSDGADEIVCELFGVLRATDLADLLRVSEVARNVRDSLIGWPHDADQYEGLWAAAEEYVALPWPADEASQGERWMLGYLVDVMESTCTRSIDGWPQEGVTNAPG